MYVNRGPEFPKIDKNIILNNLTKLEKSNNVREVIVISQNNNLEGELIYSTNLKKWEELFSLKSIKEHKNEFSNCKNLLEKLLKRDFDMKKFGLEKIPFFYLKINREK